MQAAGFAESQFSQLLYGLMGVITLSALNGQQNGCMMLATAPATGAAGSVPASKALASRPKHLQEIQNFFVVVL